MITVSQEQLDSVEYLLSQSAQGNHVLFELDMLRKVFATPSVSMTDLEIQAVEQHIKKIITLESFNQKKAYLDQLPENTLHLVVKTYFNIVENNLFEKGSKRH